jgi:replicative DNA helicase
MVATERVPPHDLDAEGAVLSAVLGPPFAIDDARDHLSAADFYADANRRVFEAACAVHDGGGSIDLVSVASRLKDTNRLNQVGGTAYLVQLVDATPACAEVATHCRVVAGKSLQRRIILAAQTVVAEGYAAHDDVGEWAQRAEQIVFDAAEKAVAQWPTETAAEVVPRLFREAEERQAGRARATERYFPVPWAALREFYPSGLPRSKVHVVAARPSMGKSAFCSELARQGSGRGLGALIVSLEMPREDIVARLLSAHSSVELNTIKHGRPNVNEWSAMTSAGVELSRLPISVCFRPGATIAHIRSIIRREAVRMKREAGCELGLVIVDYMQIISSAWRSGSREAEVADFSRQLLAIAGEFNIALVEVSQLNRKVEERTDKRPQLSDLRESGAIEQDADSIIFLYRDDYYDDRSKWPGLCETRVAKNRNGGTGMARLTFTRKCCAFDSESDEQQGAWDWDGYSDTN